MWQRLCSTSDLLNGLSLKGLSLAMLPTPPEAVQSPGLSCARVPKQHHTYCISGTRLHSDCVLHLRAGHLGFTQAEAAICSVPSKPLVMPHS